MDIEQCKDTYEMLKKGKQFIANIDKDFFLIFAETVLSELEKKDKVINEMAEQLAGLAIFDIEKDEPLVLGDKEEVKQYFTNKVEREGK